MLKVDKYGRWIFEHSIITPQGYIKAIKGDEIEYTQKIELVRDDNLFK